ncbi:ABC transporter permease [Peloplasma aerotolerans]|uniref:ABC transporter permease n=1 Tax=Peloplasma aerotolerans TaxID=3044389 RepID=A0AAW6U3L8_9MOLU|nr:ABC transporter permease [Mariniplasma sp. M4Ah]MDI6452482.1 ABC transporter permease [Mariniplasma sp. M4Ah]
MQANALRVKNKPKKKLEFFLSIPYYFVLISLVVVPIFLLVISSFQFDNRSGIYPISFTFDHYLDFLRATAFVRAMTASLWIAAATTVVTLMIGYPLAYILTKMKLRTQIALLLLINAPMWINMLLRVRALEQIMRMFFPYLIDTVPGVVLGLVYVYLPFMVLPIYAVLSKIDPNYLESSADLGANKFKTIVKVVIPLSLSGVLAGILMVFLPAATTIIIPQYLAPSQNIYMIGTLIEKSIINNGRISYASAVAIVLSIVILGIVYYIKKLDRYKGVNQNEKETY